MTLCIGLKYPWGVPNGRNPPPREGTTAVILATDSRWVFPGSYQAPVDRAQKLFQIARNAAVAYAGDALLAEQCIPQLMLLAPEPSPSKRRLTRQMIQERLVRAHEDHCWEKECQGEEGMVEFMMGIYEEPIGGDVFVFRSEGGFAAEKTEGIHTIGNAEAGQRFRDEFQRIVTTADSQGSAAIKELRLFDIVACVAEALERVKAWDTQMEVAGWTECMSIDRNGVQIWTLRRTSDPTNQGPGWTRVTPQRGDIGTTTEML